jgi:hypothetical protein
MIHDKALGLDRWQILTHGDSQSIIKLKVSVSADCHW